MTIFNAAATFAGSGSLRGNGNAPVYATAVFAASSSLKTHLIFKAIRFEGSFSLIPRVGIRSTQNTATLKPTGSLSARLNIKPVAVFMPAASVLANTIWTSYSHGEVIACTGSTLRANATVKRLSTPKQKTGATKRAIDETTDIITLMLDALLASVISFGITTPTLRRQIGFVKASVGKLIDSNSLGMELAACFTQARLAGASLPGLENVRKLTTAETPYYDLAVLAKLTGIVLCLVEESNTIADMVFASRSDAEKMMLRADVITEEIKLDVAELLDGLAYQNVVALSAALIMHLAATERQLPLIVSFDMNARLPSLYLANYLYGDADRSEELILENKVVHPAFMPEDVLAMTE